MSGSRRLAQEIAAAPSSSAALAILRRAKKINQIHVTACLHRVALKPVDSRQLEVLLEQLQVEQLDAEALAINAWSLAKLWQAAGKTGAELRQSLWYSAAQRRSEISARHLSNLLWSVATSRDGTTETVLAFSDMLMSRLVDLSPQGLANCFWALSKLKAERGSIALDALALQGELRISELQPQDLASMLWSASAFAVRFGRLAGLLAPAAAAARAQLSGRQLTNAAWAAATILPDSGDAVAVLVAEALTRQLNVRDLPNLCWAQANVAAAAPPGLAEAVHHRLPELHAKLPDLLWALAVCGANAAPLLLEVAGTGPSAARAAQLLWCQATLRQPGGCELLSLAEQHACELEALDLSRCAWAAATLGQAEHRFSAAQGLASAVAEVEVSAPATVVQVSWSLAKLQLFVPAAMQRLSRCSGLQPQDLALCLWAFAFWHFAGDGQNRLLAEAQRCVGEFAPQDLANVAWALASLLSTPEPLLAALASEAQRNRAQILFEANRA